MTIIPKQLAELIEKRGKEFDEKNKACLPELMKRHGYVGTYEDIKSFLLTTAIQAWEAGVSATREAVKLEISKPSVFSEIMNDPRYDKLNPHEKIIVKGMSDVYDATIAHILSLRSLNKME